MHSILLMQAGQGQKKSDLIAEVAFFSYPMIGRPYQGRRIQGT